MSNFPNNIDDNSTLPIVDNNIMENGAEAISSLRDAVLAIENNIGTNPGTRTIEQRLSVIVDDNGNIVVTSIPTVVANNSITNAQVASNAAIAETKLNLQYSTSSLNSGIQALNSQTNSNTTWINTYGTNFEVHLEKTNSLYNHELNDIFLSSSEQTSYLTAWGTELAPNTTPTLDDLLTSINNYYIAHQEAAGISTTLLTGLPIIASNGSEFPNIYAHHAAGIYVDTTGFHNIEQQQNSLQEILNTLDNQSNLTYGSKIQNFYNSGITIKTRSLNFEPITEPVSSGSDGVISGVVSGVVTFTSATITYANISVGNTITISGATGPGSVNNGVFTITAVGTNYIQFVNSQAIADTVLIWSVSATNPYYGFSDIKLQTTPCVTTLEADPNDSLTNGDDVVVITSPNVSPYHFEQGIPQINIGDLAVVTYTTSAGTVVNQGYIIGKRIQQTMVGGNSVYQCYLRLSTKNLMTTTYPATNGVSSKIFVCKPNYSLDKNGVLNISPVNPSDSTINPSLIVANPAGAFCLSQDFNPFLFDTTHYNLYLLLYPTYTIETQVTPLVISIDCTGNQGQTPGLYTLDNTVNTMNKAFRATGVNSRFVAFKYNGEVGIMLADPYQSASFAVLAGVLNTSTGTIVDDTTTYINNVVGLNQNGSIAPVDPFGFGSRGQNLTSAYPTNISNGQNAYANPLKLFTPHRNNYYYANGAENQTLADYSSQQSETLTQSSIYNGLGYFWRANVVSQNVTTDVNSNYILTTVYRIYTDISQTKIRVGSTIVVLPDSQNTAGAGTTYDFNYGRFIISNIAPPVCIGTSTVVEYYDVTVQDAHVVYFGQSTTITPNFTYTTDTVLDTTKTIVDIYFNNDSVSFDKENIIDNNHSGDFDNYFEIFVNQDQKTFCSQRARKVLNTTSSPPGFINGVPVSTFTNADQIQIINVSPKLTGFLRAGTSTSMTGIISLYVDSYDNASGIYTVHLAKTDLGVQSQKGPEVSGRVGLITRVYDDTYVDYIDILINTTNDLTGIAGHYVDIQLFPTLQLNDELLLLGSCNYYSPGTKLSSISPSPNSITSVQDERSFGVVSIEDFNNEAINYISNFNRLTRTNGVIRGFDIDLDPVVGQTDQANPLQFKIKGGACAINGKVVVVNDQMISPKDIRFYNTSETVPYWVCINGEGKIELIPSNTNSYMIAVNYYNNNVQVGTYYSVYTYGLQDLIDVRKDIVVLYQYAGKNGDNIYSGTGNFTLPDFRKYNVNIELVKPCMLSDELGYGQFNTFESLFNWMFYLPDAVHNVYINGTATYNQSLNIAYNCVFDGENLGTLNLNGTENIIYAENVVFKNLTINLGANAGFLSNGSPVNNIEFINCNINCAGALIPGYITSSANIKIIDCNITSTATLSSNLIYVTNSIEFRKNTVNIYSTTSNYQSQKVIFAYVSDSDTNPDNIIIEDNTVYTAGYFVSITGSNTYGVMENVSIKNNIVNTSLDASTVPCYNLDVSVTGKNLIGGYGGLFSVPSEADYLNSLQDGLIYLYVGSINKLDISNNQFNYSFSTKRFPYICLLSNGSSGQVSLGINIDNNKFNTTGLSSGSFPNAVDHKAAVVVGFYNTGNRLLTNSPVLSVISGSISGNNCYQRQSIIVSQVENDPYHLWGIDYDSTGSAIHNINSQLLACGNLKIDNNSCGVIGTLLTTTTPTITTNGLDVGDNSGSQLLNKTGKLSIKNNNCLWITNLTATGRYIYPYNIDIFTGSGTLANVSTNNYMLGGTSYGSKNPIYFNSKMNAQINTTNYNTFVNILGSYGNDGIGKIYKSYPCTNFIYSPGLDNFNIYFTTTDSLQTSASSGPYVGQPTYTFSMYVLEDVLNFDLCNVEVSENVCSWIHLISSTQHQISSTNLTATTSNIIIENNQLNANDYNFLKLFPCQLFYYNNVGSVCSAYPQQNIFDYSVGNFDSIYYYKQNPSFLNGASQAFAISVLSNTAMGITENGNKNNNYSNAQFLSSKTIINNNTISPQYCTDTSVYPNVSRTFYYGYDYLSSNLVGGGFINCQTPSIITNNNCSKFYGSNPLMRVGLITVGDTATITDNSLGRIFNNTNSNNSIWNYIMVAPIFNGLCTSSDFLMQQYTTVYLNTYAPNVKYSTLTPIKPSGIINNNIFDYNTCCDFHWSAAYNSGDTSQVQDVGNGNVSSSMNWTVFTTSYIPDSWICKDNKNQTDMLSIALGGDDMKQFGQSFIADFTASVNPPSFIAGLPSNITNITNPFSIIVASSSNNPNGQDQGGDILAMGAPVLMLSTPPAVQTYGTASYSKLINLNKYLPSGAKLVKAEIISMVSTNATSSTGLTAAVEVLIAIGHMTDNYMSNNKTIDFNYNNLSSGGETWVYDLQQTPTNIFYQNGSLDYRSMSSKFYSWSADGFNSHIAGSNYGGTIHYSNNIITSVSDSSNTYLVNNVIKSDHNYLRDTYLEISAQIEVQTSGHYTNLYLSPIYLYYVY
jgi:hypothetical protein